MRWKRIQQPTRSGFPRWIHHVYPRSGDVMSDFIFPPHSFVDIYHFRGKATPLEGRQVILWGQLPSYFMGAHVEGIFLSILALGLSI